MTMELLSRQEERALAERWQKERHEPSMHRLVECYLPMASKAAKKYRNCPVPYEDLVQEAVAGLIRAANTFEPERGFRFSTYARWWVQAQVTESVFQTSNVVRPTTGNNGKSRYFRGENNTVVMSLETQISAEGMTLAEVIEDPGMLPDEAVELSVDTERRAAAIKAAMERLPERERVIIEGRFFAEETSTLDEIAKIYGVSKERIRQLEKKALGRLEKLLSAPGVRGLLA